MATLTYAEFVAYYTEFANTSQYPQAVVERYIDQCSLIFPLDPYGETLRYHAWRAATAHSLVVWYKHKRGAFRVGSQSSNSVGSEISESFVKPPYSADDASFHSTVYGEEVIRIKGLLFVGPLVAD
tara:strand:- start:18 stop:395 length:378 start_codon:yes stop_codon:yes gene_type:complete